ncbi:MAG: NAD(P)-dependent oxidoreductase [Planctomycetota bacterium]|nr:NAD(P)-dependent oxidoreductase [Planctomycetota bacterium]
MNRAAARRSSVGLVGLGLLGSAIARRLGEGGHELVGHDLDESRVRSLGVSWAPSAAEVASAARRVLLCLPDSSVVEQVVEGEGGLLASPEPPELVLDTTTGDPRRSAALAKRLQARGVAYVEACVSGSSADMLRGDAALLVGGAPRDVEAAQDILDSLSGVVYHLGDVASGIKAKLASNLLLGLQRLALSEALVFGERLGLPPATLLEVLRAGPAYSRAIDAKGEKMVRSDFEPQARLSQHLKDVGLILEEARRAGISLPLSHLHREILEEAVAQGLGERDNSAVIEALRRRMESSRG